MNIVEAMKYAQETGKEVYHSSPIHRADFFTIGHNGTLQINNGPAVFMRMYLLDGWSKKPQ